MTFDEAADAVLADPDLCLVGIYLDMDGHLSVYFMDEGPAGSVHIHFQKAKLFGAQVGEGNYTVESVPSGALLLEYVDRAAVFSRFGLTEHALAALFPGTLPDPASADPSEFLEQALAAAYGCEFLTVGAPPSEQSLH